MVLPILWLMFVVLDFPPDWLGHLETGVIQQAEGKIIGFRPGNGVPSDIVQLKDGRIAEHQSSGQFFTGQKIKVYYRTGPTGVVYIDRLESIKAVPIQIGK